MRRPWALVGMAVVVVGGLAWLTLKANANSSRGLAWVERTQLREVILQHAATEFEVHYLMVDGKWALSNPPGYFLDRPLAEDITKAIQDLRLGEPFVPVEPLDAYGLGMYAWRVVTRAGHDEVAFRVGEGGPTKATYLKVEGEERVFPAGQWLVSRFNRPVEEFVDMRLSHSTPAMISSLRLETSQVVPGVTDPERPDSTLVLEVRRQADGEWRDMLTDRPLSARRVEGLLAALLTLEGGALFGSGIVDSADATLTLGRVGEEEPEIMRFGRLASGWGAWGVAPFGYLMGAWQLADLPWHTPALARLQVVEFDPFSDHTLVLPDGTSLAYTREDSDPAAVALAKVLRAPWADAAVERAEAPATPGLRLAVEHAGSEPLVLTLWPEAGIARVGSAAGTWRLAPEWWGQLAAAGVADG